MLKPETVEELIRRIPMEDGVFIAGGQALNYRVGRQPPVRQLTA